MNLSGKKYEAKGKMIIASAAFEQYLPAGSAVLIRKEN